MPMYSSEGQTNMERWKVACEREIEALKAAMACTDPERFHALVRLALIRHDETVRLYEEVRRPR